MSYEKIYDTETRRSIYLWIEDEIHSYIYIYARMIIVFERVFPFRIVNRWYLWLYIWFCVWTFHEFRNHFFTTNECNLNKNMSCLLLRSCYRKRRCINNKNDHHQNVDHSLLLILKCARIERIKSNYIINIKQRLHEGYILMKQK